jgi:hypothetical protein
MNPKGVKYRFWGGGTDKGIWFKKGLEDGIFLHETHKEK